MPITHIVVLALIQGITEFLPVSSSAHLIFPSQLLGWEDQGIAFDVAVHLGTLLAVVIYYISDLYEITIHTIKSMITRKQTPQSRIGWFIIIGTIPAAVAGLLLEEFVSTAGRSIHIIAYTTIGFGLLLGLASYVNRKMNWHTKANLHNNRPDSLRKLNLAQTLVIGFSQALALIPGTSRSGITMTAGLFLGMRPEAAARFSFLLSIPIILASALLEGIKLVTSDVPGVANPVEMLVGGIIAFITALIVIALFMRFISKSGMAVFVIYRILLGFGLLFFLA
ncbi:MAG: undecaprenyl-diphosphate phosphatase [Anaerobiospirillum succiniciproducens]|uniref:undecaprenyl-diphosphate phosphatase n=1 Tax=Anaerobiospirillum succiniciproducens TaxID=13335 RepID=UPI0026DC2269|nr:undecaprenyl-diphosphate phosphatase [Anaerobiospirillum succiniciproducens]MDO4676723.1 undecaprenyl-diphosphate phosphatase [Anaerobiospirillum succiniciproducens]